MKRNQFDIKEIGFIDKGTGKHQSNIVYSAGGIAPTLTASLGVKTSVMILDLVCKTDTCSHKNEFEDNGWSN